MAQKFVYMASGQEVTLDDPADSYTPDQIKQHWTTTFPELSNASWEEKRAEDGTKVITFAKKVGTKGADWVSVANYYPEESELVIVFFDGMVTVGDWLENEDGQMEWAILDEDRTWDDLGAKGVTHWMRLPPPPVEAAP